MTSFFAALDELVIACPVIIDRPSGSTHPCYPHVIYPVDYGYLDGSRTTDGQGIDVFRGATSGAGVVGVIVSVDGRKKDVEMKILVDCSDDEVNLAHKLFVTLQLGIYLIRREHSTVET